MYKYMGSISEKDKKKTRRQAANIRSRRLPRRTIEREHQWKILIADFLVHKLKKVFQIREKPRRQAANIRSQRGVPFTHDQREDGRGNSAEPSAGRQRSLAAAFLMHKHH